MTDAHQIASKKPTSRQSIQYFFACAAMLLFKMISPQGASNLSARLARKIGPLTNLHKKAKAHLEMALPGKTPEEYKQILAGMWDNLGRVLGEYSDLEEVAIDTDLVGAEHLKDALEKYGQVILFSGHIGNWEIMAPTLLQFNIQIDLVYRAPNNPGVDKMLRKFRSLDGRINLLPKSKSGTRKLVESIQAGRSVGILMNQKYNEGIEVPFMGFPAMTTTSFVELSQRYKTPLVPFRVERIDGMKFRLSFFPILKVNDDHDQPLPVQDVVMAANRMIESWIIERPEQWLWTHNRWKNGSVESKAEKV